LSAPAPNFTKAPTAQQLFGLEPPDAPSPPTHPDGALLLSDVFTPSAPGTEAHGNLVLKAARSTGYSGPIMSDSMFADDVNHQSKAELAAPPMAMQQSETALVNPQASKADTLKAIDSYAIN
jgi:hypothetical protein